MNDEYHHGDLRAALLRLGLETLETEGSEALSLRTLAEQAGVSKTAPYRHYRNKAEFLGALVDEGYRLLFLALSQGERPGTTDLAAMGRRYMSFAAAHPALYRLMNSPVVCRLPEARLSWARRSLEQLGGSLAAEQHRRGGPERPSPEAIAAAWGYIHGLALLRIDALFPPWEKEPDWDYLAGIIPVVADGAVLHESTL